MQRIILVTFLLLLWLPQFAQNKRRTQESTRVLMEVGPALVWLNGESTDFTDNISDFTFGLGVTRPLYGPVYLHTGVYMGRWGNQAFGDFVDQNGQILTMASIRSRLDYGVVPALLRLEFGDRARFYLQAGPYAAVLVQALQFPQGTASRYNPRDVTAQYRRLDYGFATGIGANVTLHDNFVLNVETRYSQGFADIQADTAPGAAAIQNAGLDLRLGLGFWLPAR